MTIQAHPQDDSLRYIPWTQMCYGDVDNLTGIAQQYAADIAEILEETSTIIMRNNIRTKKLLIEKDKECREITCVNYLMILVVVVLVTFIAMYTFFMIAHELEWLRIFKSW